ncbi:MAG: M14 family zinc carboxypeptidase [Bacteroidota bacterium]
MSKSITRVPAERIALIVLFAVFVCVTCTLNAGEKPVRFFGSDGRTLLAPGEFDPSIPSPEQALHFVLGERPARHAQVLEYFRTLAASSKRVKLFDMGKTYEDRPLIYAVISDEANITKLDEIKKNIQAIADPRATSRARLDALVNATPAVAWMAYSIHGDEISGVDASLAVAYRLAAGMDSLTQRLRKDLIVIIDPTENPDGRERYLAQMEAFATAVPLADGQSLQKGGFWPWGRGNHYLFDMNRDWFSEELPESKARIKSIVEWNPQLVVDAHEMGQWDTYLFSPPRHPFNPYLTDRVKHWWGVYAADQARAFDQRGWAYYTREWNEELFPGYGSSWSLYTGGLGILYEQAGVSGSRISRHDGTVLTYSESVEHQYVSSIANLTTAANNRKQLLLDYYTHRQRAISEYGGGKVKTYIVAPDSNPDRLAHLAQTLIRQGIEVSVAKEKFSAPARSYYDQRSATNSFPAGALVIPTNQPQGFLAQAILTFDIQLSDSFLTFERRELLKRRESKLYEITSWSLLQAYGLDAYASESEVSPAMEPWKDAPRAGRVDGMRPQQGFIFDANSDGALRAIAMMYSRGLTMFAAKKDLDVEGKNFPRGSIFLPVRTNPPDFSRVLDSIARETGIQVVGISSGMGIKGPDLGGSELGVLRKPKAALVAGGSTSSTSMGWIWHLLDQKIGLPLALLDIAQLGSIDLSIYNVLILPDGGSYASVMGSPTIEKIRRWVQSGGTLIAMNSSAMFCADSTTGLSSVRQRSQVLAKLTEYEQSAMQEIANESPDVAKLHIWSYPEKPDTASRKEPKSGLTPAELERAEEIGRVFAPSGAILRVELDQEEWLTFGMGEKVPVMMTSSTALVAKYPPVRTVGRFAPAPALRISGLLWPEARLRLAGTPYCTQESIGMGQVILFAGQPNFRAYFRGTERLLSNAILFGPGLGTSWTPEW